MERRIVNPNLPDTIIKDENYIEQEYKTGELIGRGGYGTIYAGTKISNNLTVALKYVSKSKIDTYHTKTNCIIPSELYSLTKLKNIQGVITLLDCYQNETTYIYVLERPMPCKDLFEIIGEKGALNERRAKNIFRQIINTVMRIGDEGVIHADIKDENIIVNTETDETKLIDFCNSTESSDKPCTNFSGTSIFATPEWMTSRSFKLKEATTWTLGTLLYNMIYGFSPFNSTRETVCQEPIFSKDIQVSGRCQELIVKCLQKTLITE